jgi:hypothetical protein
VFVVVLWRTENLFVFAFVQHAHSV